MKPGNDPLTFKMTAVGKPFDPVLKPFYQTVDQYYSVYWDYFTPAEWTKLEAEYEAEKNASRRLQKEPLISCGW
jgi:hypothetical protein